MRAFLLLLLLLTVPSLRAERMIIAPAWTARNTPTVTVDSILLRDTMSRLYITLKQLPHTTLTLHDDWVIQDSTGRFTGKVRDIDGVDFNRIFQFENDSTIGIEMDFPALPPSLNKFDLTGNRLSGEIRIIGITLSQKQKTALAPQLPRPTPSPPFPAITFEPDSALLRGKLIGYHKRLNIPDGKIVLTDLFTGRQTILTVPIANNGTFSIQIPVCHPMQQRLILGDRYLSFYIEPSDTIDIQVSLDELFAPYRFIGEIEQNCSHLIYQGRNAQTNYELRQVRLQNVSETEEWLKAMYSLTPARYHQLEIDKFKAKLELLNRDLTFGKLSKKSYLLSILNHYYLFLSHLIVYNDIKNKYTNCECDIFQKTDTLFAIFSPLNNPSSVASEYYLPFITLLENREASMAPPDWSSTEFIEALEIRGVIVSSDEKEALKFALGESKLPPENARSIIEQFNKRCEKEQISMREEKLRLRRKEIYHACFGRSDDFTRQLLDARRAVKLMQSQQRTLTPIELDELSASIPDRQLQYAVEHINSSIDKCIVRARRDTPKVEAK